MEPQHQASSLRSRVTRELKAYAGLCLYLYVCVGAILLYRAAILGEHRYGVVPYGTGVIKALVLAKFVMLGQAARLGERWRPRSLVLAVLLRSALFLLLLIVLSGVEEVVTGMIHGRSAEQALAEDVTGRQWEIAASCLLLWLVLLPYLGLQHLRAAMGTEEWRRLLLGRRTG